MLINLTLDAVQHIQSKGGQAAVDLLSFTSWGGNATEVSVDTRITRRDISMYRKIKQDGLELFILPSLADHTTVMNIESKKFLFFRNLKADLELENGIVLGRRTSWD